jgi:glucan-binding YG repeat protein
MGVSELLQRERKEVVETDSDTKISMGQALTNWIVENTNTYLFKDKLTLYAGFVKFNSGYQKL